MYAKEENNYPKAVAISTIIMGLMLAISFFIVIGSFKPNDDYGMGGMVVNYGTAETGFGDDYTSVEEPSMAPDANNQLPDKVTPDQQPTTQQVTAVDAKDIQTQNTEDAISLNTKAVKPSTNPATTDVQKPAVPAINQNALYKGNKNNGLGRGDGTGTTPGNQGEPDGDPMSPEYGKGGSGFGDTPISLGKFSNLITPVDDSQIRGKVAIRVTINKQGVVTSAEFSPKFSTTTDTKLVEKSKKAMLGARYNRQSEGPEVQRGIVIFNYGLN